MKMLMLQKRGDVSGTWKLTVVLLWSQLGGKNDV